uniref:Putative nuclease HARBI1 n=1 Tax=Crassostrea virginica TaxID=6565 RepID=A0A8B8CGS5_CRAVI|nr:putative nuclease HARBI1 [Crassostrea virginica]
MAATFIVLSEHEPKKRKMPVPRIFRDRTNPLEGFSDTELISRYRFPRHGILELLDLIEKDVSRPTGRSYAIPAVTQILVFLRYLAKGDFQSECGDIHEISQPTVSRIIGSVSHALDSKLTNVKFPTSSYDIVRTKNNFFKIAKFPGVIGAIDGTLIPILAPKEDEHAYICRKGYHALNVQGVVDANHRFINFVCKWPGSVHDSFIFRESQLFEVLQRRNLGWLVGDSGYALKSFLMTPKSNPQTEAEEKYNRAHSRTRVVVERAFGILKSRSI